MVFAEEEEGSFRDPAGQVIKEDGIYLRRINVCFHSEYNYFMACGLYNELTDRGLMLRHEVVGMNETITIKPEQLPFVSYPYEWPFSMLKEAAIVTLEANRLAIDRGMMLKDASAYNIQWHKGYMKLIDTLSFMKYNEGQPWIAYRQFIEQFLAPLLLMAYRDPALSQLSALSVEGVPVKLAAKLLPMRLKLKPSLLMHFYSQTLAERIGGGNGKVSMPKRNLIALLGSLGRLVKGLGYKPKSQLINYSGGDSYSTIALASKEVFVRSVLGKVGRGTLCDLGANTGEFSSIAAEVWQDVIAIDREHDCLENIAKANYAIRILPLVIDLCNPSPGIGWANTERRSFWERLYVDTIMALALIHHLCIGNNIPVGRVARLLAGHCKHLVIEFVPEDDPKSRLLAGGKVYPAYSKGIFEDEFGKYFTLQRKEDIEDSCRSIYHYQIK